MVYVKIGIGDFMKFIIIRHGETYANALFNTDDRILIGALDAPISQLNETGILQAHKTKEIMSNIKVDEIYCSDLGRTKQTANIIFEGKNIEYTALLRERSLGSDEGKRVDEVFSKEDVWKYHVNSELDPIDECLSKKVIDGECYNDVINRCKKFLSKFDYSDNKTIVVVAHFHFIRCFIYQLLNKEPDRELFTMMIHNSSPIVYSFNNGKFVEEVI